MLLTRKKPLINIEQKCLSKISMPHPRNEPSFNKICELHKQQLEPEAKEQNSNINQIQFHKPNSLNQASEYQTVRAGRLAWLGRWLYEPKVAGSSPARPTPHRVQAEITFISSKLCRTNYVSPAR